MAAFDMLARLAFIAYIFLTLLDLGLRFVGTLLVAHVGRRRR